MTGQPASLTDPAAPLDIPAAWRRLPLDDLRGLLIVIGGVDVGKSTFARYLFDQLQQIALPAAFLDGDPGQSALGPPTTMTISPSPPAGRAGEAVISPSASPGRMSPRRWFVGSTTPVHHMLPLLTGAARLSRFAFESGAAAVVYDTSGFIDPSAGGVALKHAKLDLLQPAAVFALQHSDELEPLLAPLRRSQRFPLYELRPSPAVRPRSPEVRRQRRIQRFRRYFTGAQTYSLGWNQLPVFPAPFYRRNRLLAIEDSAGFTLALGIIVDLDRPARRLALLTPHPHPEQANALRLGDILIDPGSFEHERMDQ